MSALKPGGHFIIGTFAKGGPIKCHGLDVVCYTSEGLQATVGSGLELVHSFNTTHKTPFDTTQNFLYAHFRKIA